MGKTLRFSIIVLFLAFVNFANACVCGMVPIEESIKNYPFIGRVRIVGEIIGDDTVFATDPSTQRRKRTGNLLLEILELFKGEPIYFLKENDINSSCEIGILPGEEWIIFANLGTESNVYQVGACNPSAKLKDRNGERGYSWAWNRHEGLLSHLRNKFNHQSPEPVYSSGVYHGQYPNGKNEWEAAYSAGKLNGVRKIWYADGGLWKEENYSNGTKEGAERYFARSGQLISELEYSKGNIVHSVYWFDTSLQERRMRSLFTIDRGANRDSILRSRPVRIQKSSEGLYDPSTGWRFSQTFTETGELESEAVSYNEEMIRINCRYKDQKLDHEVMYWKQGDHTIEKRWNDKGELVSLKEWIKGKYQGEKLNR